MINSLAIAVQGIGFAPDVVALQGFIDAEQARGGYMPGMRVYVRRKDRLMFFDTLEDADAWVEAEEIAETAIKVAQKTSRRARKRLRERLLAQAAPTPAETVQTSVLDRLQQMYGFTLPDTVMGSVEVVRIMEMQALLEKLRQYEEDITMLLFAA